MSEPKFTNALAGETSPYLLQHAHNPVQWHPWGEEALSLARQQEKPILLSIGYSACHWCHVMERESFEDEEVAALMNKYFINIKVDREERPDLDSIYMAAVQMMTGSGGWPMTVFLTPEGVPFYGGTYFPPNDRHGMPGFPRVLLSVAGAWKEKRDLIRHDAARMIDGIRDSELMGETSGSLSKEILEAATESLLRSYDSQHGGFSRAPKFPPSMSLSFLLRRAWRTGDSRALEAVEHTLQRMARGGMCDQLGGGFHRYSVDAHWLVPHFEKMLYDNALLSRIYLDAWLHTGNPLYRRIAEETLDYVRREMTSPEGGFYSSQDADSEGHEGKFFVWSREEIISLLGADDGEVFCRCHGVTEAGNFEGANILYLPRPQEEAGPELGLSPESLSRILAAGKARLFQAREKRVKPGRDEKVLAAWNGLMLRSFSEAASALDREDYLDTAVRNAEFLTTQMEKGGQLLRSWKDGRARFNAYLEDYACLIDGLISLYEATFDFRWIRKAESLASLLVESFWDERGGNFFFTSRNHEQLIHRPKDIYDNATPSGNSAAAYALLRLAGHTGNLEWAAKAGSILEGMAGVLGKHPYGFSHYLCGLDFYLAGATEAAIAGEPADPGTRKMIRSVFAAYCPDKVVACGLDKSVPLLTERIRPGMPVQAFLCRNRTCKPPINDPAALADEIRGNTRS
jgi:uncharacterized protein